MLLKIVLLLTKPGILAVGLYIFLLFWNDYLYCLTLVKSDELRAVSLRYLGELSYDCAKVMAVLVVKSTKTYDGILYLDSKK